jgi:hypothetical protein
MNIFWLTHPRLTAPLRALLNRFSVQPQFLRASTVPALLHPAVAIDAVARRSLAQSSPSRRPLRVVRILESGQTPAQVGRLVISGRMADVCAELDRLVACEAARH